VLRETAKPEHFAVTGTDISLNALHKAREGVYGARRLEQMDTDLCERYFAAQADGRFKVVQGLAARVPGFWKPISRKKPKPTCSANRWCCAVD